MKQPNRDPIRFQRANYVVSNLEESYKFYLEVLGFELTFEKESEPDSYSYDVFSIDKKHSMRFAILSTASQPRVMALTEVASPILERPANPLRSALVLDIDDIDSTVAGAKALGLEIYHEDPLITHDGREGREIGILDRDGNLVIIYNIPPAK